MRLEARNNFGTAGHLGLDYWRIGIQCPEPSITQKHQKRQDP
jgi:hypothetical protein